MSSKTIPAALISQPEPDRVVSLKETAEICDLSVATLRRVIAAGRGPKLTRLSARRVGVRQSHRETWLAAQSADCQHDLGLGRTPPGLK